MVQFVTGVPGSGKTYYGIFIIFINFAMDLLNNKKFKKLKSFAISKTKYKTCLTNLNELKFDNFQNVKPLNFNDFRVQLSKLYNLYKLNYTDSQLEDVMKDEDFFYTLIVIDECHNVLNKDDEVLVWWLSYHRHFHQDIILITQDIPLVNSKYKAFTEFYYKAIPSSRKLFNTEMVYHQYTGHQMYKTQKATTKKLPIVKEVFSLYGSGENNSQKSLVKHYLILAFSIFIFLLIGLYFVLSNMGSSDDNKIENTNKLPTTPAPIQNVSINPQVLPIQDSTYYEMSCNKNLCFVNGNVFNKKFILHLLKNEYISRIISSSKYKYYLVTNDKYGLFIKKEIIKNDEDKDSKQDSISDKFNFDFFNSQK